MTRLDTPVASLDTPVASPGTTVVSLASLAASSGTTSGSSGASAAPLEVPAATLATPAGGPHVLLLDARALSIDEGGLRTHARERCAAHTAAHTSRSYSFPYALAAVHGAPVGVDIERVEPCDEAFARSIGAPGEAIGAADREDRDTLLTSLWSSKEALSKALGDALAYDPRRLVSPLSWPNGRAGAWRAAALPAPPGHVAWACWRAA